VRSAKQPALNCVCLSSACQCAIASRVMLCHIHDVLQLLIAATVHVKRKGVFQELDWHFLCCCRYLTSIYWAATTLTTVG
jgi:hypothetical protein